MAVIATALGIAAACTTFESAEGPPPAADGGVDGAVEAAALEDAASVDLARDPKNCGRISHDCVGGTCKDGECQPFAIFRGTAPSPGADVSSDGRVGGSSIAVDAERVAWLTGPGGGSTISFCSKSGCTSASTATIGGSAGAIVGDAQGIYYAVRFSAEAAGVWAFATTGTTRITDKAVQVADLRLAGDRIYALDRTPSIMGGGIHTLLRDGGGYAHLAPKPNEVEISRLDVSNDAVFMSNPDAIYAKALDGSAGVQPTVITPVGGGYLGIVVDRAKGVLYYGSRDRKAVYRCPVQDAGAGCTTPTEIVQGKLTSAPNALSYDGALLYVTSDDGAQSTISSCDPDTCATTWKEIAKAPLVLGPVAFDDGAIYWLERTAPADAGDDGYRVMRRMK